MSPPIGGVRAGYISGQRNAIPDTNLDHFYYSQELSAANPWTDEEGSSDLSASGSPALQASGINGNQSMDYDAGEYHSLNSAFSLGTNDVWTAVVVVQLDDTSQDYSLLANGDADGDVSGSSNGYEIRTNNDEWQVAHNGVAARQGGTTDTNPHVLVATYDGSNAILDIDGSNVINTSIVTPNTPTSVFEVNKGFFNIPASLFGATGHEAAAADQTRRDELTQKLGDAFDISYTI